MKILSTMQKIVFFAIDRYLESSTKALERKDRSVSETIRYEVKRQEQKRPNQYLEFLQSTENKMSLLKFLLSDWIKKQVNNFQGKEIYVIFDNKGFHIFENDGSIQVDELHDLSSEKEEANTKMFLCAKYCVLLGASSVCIHTVDTDVLVLSFYYSTLVNKHFLTLDLPVFEKILGKSEEQLLYVSNADHDVDMRRALPGLHVVTGCDSVSAFFRRGQIRGFRLL